ncbi:MAG: D-2-hydroxyacid dehydrogenase [Bacteroidales bacterium]|nr:D-2-hydroxyacid dehydrogenase [Bacteroidales bacterium]
MKIVVLDGFCLNPGDLSWQGFEQLGNLEVYDRTPHEALIERSADAEALITNKTVIGAVDMAQLPHLKYIGVLATGYNVVDIAEARRRGIVVTNIPAYSTNSVAQMVFAHILNITHSVAHYATQSSQGQWSACADFSYVDTPLIELSGKTIGIVGLGNIGMAVAQIAKAFGMKVLALTSKKPSDLPEGVERADLSRLFTEADIVTLHCPLTEQTRHIVSSATLSLMKPTAILINTGRGPLVDEAALADALNNKRIMAAGLDVLSTEPPKADNPLLTARNCFITPHIAWATREARSRLMDIAVANLKAFLDGKTVNNVAQL